MNFNSRNGARKKASLDLRERRRAENDARAVRITTAAARVFARRGVENATMEMIAREANVAVGTIYLHFASRDEVYLNLCAERGTQLGAGYREVLARGLKPLEEIRTLARGLYRVSARIRRSDPDQRADALLRDQKAASAVVRNPRIRSRCQDSAGSVSPVRKQREACFRKAPARGFPGRDRSDCCDLVDTQRRIHGNARSRVPRSYHRI